MELRFAKWEVGLVWTMEEIGREKTNEAPCRTANRERTRVSPRQTLVLWRKELDKDKDWDSSRRDCWYMGRGQKEECSEMCLYAGPRLAERRLLP